MSFTSAQRRDLSLVATGRGLSLLGDEVAVLALVLWASVRGEGPLAVTALVVAAALPQLVAAPLAGLLADRVPTRRIVASVSVLQALVVVGLIAAVSSGSLPWVVLGVLALNLGQAVANPAWQALVPSLAPGDDLQRALSVLQTVSAGAMLLGPAVGGLLVGGLGITAALAVDAVSFVALTVVALALRTQRRPEPEKHEKGAAWAGVRLVAASPLLRAMFVLLATTLLAIGAVNVAEVFLLTQRLGASATVYGAIGALFALGLRVGAVAARRPLGVPAASRLLVGVLAWMSTALVVLGLAPTLAVAGAATFAVGVGNGLLNVLVQSIVVRRTPEAVLGRVFAALSALVGAGMIVATTAGGALLSVIDVRALIVACAVLSLVVIGAVGRVLWTAPDDAEPAAAPPHPVLARSAEGGAAA
ncbi:MAG TPA: MFS transporter [Candidatus Nanopelagicales bacterium]|nr:MFS transporter [Candidatus Nanopelagicales bacterium]